MKKPSMWQKYWWKGRILLKEFSGTPLPNVRPVIVHLYYTFKPTHCCVSSDPSLRSSYLSIRLNLWCEPRADQNHMISFERIERAMLLHCDRQYSFQRCYLKLENQAFSGSCVKVNTSIKLDSNFEPWIISSNILVPRVPNKTYFAKLSYV